uniref:beta-galactoside alpha-(2,6)-sialyltransferase n=1 Tax=Eptatretus burgeri TaxID=7764 RepID=A0A8C4QPP0_EPTBU
GFEPLTSDFREETPSVRLPNMAQVLRPTPQEIANNCGGSSRSRSGGRSTMSVPGGGGRRELSFIHSDAHDYIMRFNSAPTAGFENDVGSRTSIRLMNSQVTSASFIHSLSLLTLPWFHNPDFDFFPTFLRRRQQQPHQNIYLIHPAFYWGLWDILNDNSDEELPLNPPSSGFMGLMLMLWLCDEVRAYEFLPSLRFTELCHYHENLWIRECSTGAYHPLLLEKQILRYISISTPNEVYNGRATIHGFRSMSWSTCET